VYPTEFDLQLDSFVNLTGAIIYRMVYCFSEGLRYPILQFAVLL